MFKNIKNNKGFTLIELLAVIVILGILMIIAIPAVTKYINNSKKDAFADNAGAFINSARYSLLNDEYDCQAPGADGQEVFIPISVIDLDKGNSKSSYNATYKDTSYVKAKYSSGKIVYSICLVDASNNGTKKNSNAEVLESDLSRNTIAVKTATGCSRPSGVTTCNKRS